MNPLDSSIDRDVQLALDEDIGPGDASAALIPEATRMRATLISRDAGVMAGRAWAERAFERCGLDAGDCRWEVEDGDALEAGRILARFDGPARALLTAERTALNFIQLLSGIATRTAAYVAAVDGTGTKILDTRKTLPGLRVAQKYAVRVGGGHNHRLGLYDLIMLKENHIAAAGGIAPAVAAARNRFPTLAVEVEVETLDELDQALQARADRIMLDNFSLEALAEGVARANGQAILEASGNVTLDTVRTIAETGVDEISVGELTKRITPLDLSLRFSD
ncbi:carboxylating nicotinate-nucleotide diphosphorylase [Wenzhouxiangella marina]|uniref:Probable nicotinate-nucleotide pyrophosphorylase [carboxylating] n=1 Tax=Wenzhouxiangella marina TaxID=1579979 RepID=A0A0K0XVJ5_9GAMM|nr:carboxylating nicotinate-nucleotide diphosphorylase [Wenzhouxiangella marina]AKS41651.1 Nicotinate-nucleotide pyrophosphorylase [Wenzhouxiangella marina]MBB6086589.1 nicotinate-nucleotide pyrophosphorylase (carboxylating) [Wenzhouxiangella marina]